MLDTNEYSLCHLLGVNAVHQCLFVQTLTNAVLLLLYVILTQTAPILVDLITALARQDLQAMEKLAKVNKTYYRKMLL